MFNFYQNLQKREKKLVLISLCFIVVFVFSIFIKNTYDSYSSSSIKLKKAKSDYEYVFNKINTFQRSLNNSSLDEKSINLILMNNNFEDSITDIKFNEIDSLIFINFSSVNIVDAVSFSEKIINKHSNQLISLKYKNLDSKVITELKFD